MKNIMVYAYTKFNLGDDLFVKILCDRYPNTNFVLYAPRKYKILFKEKGNITIIPSDSIIIRGINFAFRFLKIMNFFRRIIAKRCDAAVYIGGSLFIQGEKWREDIKNIKNLRVANNFFFLLGVNFGPFNEKEFYLEYKKIFKEYTDICFREKYSYDMFNDLSNVRMADDVVFQLSSVGGDYTQNINNIVISVIKPSRKGLGNYEDIYYKKIKDIAIYYIGRGYKVTFMSFCEEEGDKDAIEEIQSLIPKVYLNHVTKFLYKLSIEEALDVIKKSSIVIATRFHSMILGWIFNKPVFPIVYSKKMTNVMQDVGFKGIYTDFNKIDSLEPEEVFEYMETNLIDVSNQVRNSEKHFEKLDEYLFN